MDKIKSIADLQAIRDNLKSDINIRENAENPKAIKLVVGMATCGIAAGARETFSSLLEEVNNHKLNNVIIVQSGCMGLCYAEPTVEVRIPGQEPILYGNVTEDKAKEIVEKHLINGELVQNLIIGMPFESI